VRFPTAQQSPHFREGVGRGKDEGEWDVDCTLFPKLCDPACCDFQKVVCPAKVCSWPTCPECPLPGRSSVSPFLC